MKNLKNENVDNDEILDIFNETKEQDRAIENLKRDYPGKIKKLGKVFFNYIEENDLKHLKTGFPDKWKKLTGKIANPDEFFINFDDHQKPVDSLKETSSVN